MERRTRSLTSLAAATAMALGLAGTALPAYAATGGEESNPSNVTCSHPLGSAISIPAPMSPDAAGDDVAAAHAECADIDRRDRPEYRAFLDIAWESLEAGTPNTWVERDRTSCTDWSTNRQIVLDCAGTHPFSGTADRRVILYVGVFVGDDKEVRTTATVTVSRERGWPA